MKYPNDHVSEGYLAAVVKRRKEKADVGASVKVNRRTGPFCELPLARAVIRMHVGVDYCFDGHTMALGNLYVLIDLELRIDDRAAALTPSTKNVGCATRLRV